MKICYVSQNQLHLWENGETAALSSQRMEQYFRTLEDLDKRNAWKTEGTRRTLAKGVLHYQLLPDGTLYYTNGRHIIRRTPEGKEESLVQGKAITLFAVLPEEA